MEYPLLLEGIILEYNCTWRPALEHLPRKWNLRIGDQVLNSRQRSLNFKTFPAKNTFWGELEELVWDPLSSCHSITKIFLINLVLNNLFFLELMKDFYGVR